MFIIVAVLAGTGVGIGIHVQKGKEKEEKIKEKAIELTEEYRSESSNAIKNVFADIFSLIAFGLVIF